MKSRSITRFAPLLLVLVAAEAAAQVADPEPAEPLDDAVEQSMDREPILRTDETAAQTADAPEPSAAGAGEGVDQTRISEAELLAELEEIRDEAVQRGVRISGFMDFNYSHTFRRDALFALADRNESFFVGSANVYVQGNVNARLRSLLELRFTYLPNGAPKGDGEFTRTSTIDYADHNRPVTLGGIEIERAHGEYKFDQLLTVRFGQFLTPYGIWNVDHGSPTVIPIGIPYAIGQGLIPERQTGFELLGTYDVGDTAQVRYHLTLSNGRGPFESHLDLDNNKAIGGRLQLVLNSAVGDVSVGASTYYGRYTNASAVDIRTGERQILSQYDELALAGDVKWTHEGLHAQGEVVHQQVAYTEQGRAYLAPDSANWGAYGLAGYRIPVLELMPFVKYERQDDQYFDLMSWTAGLNYRPFPELVLKASASLVKFRFESIDGESTRADAQIAWAF